MLVKRFGLNVFTKETLEIIEKHKNDMPNENFEIRTLTTIITNKNKSQKIKLLLDYAEKASKILTPLEIKNVASAINYLNGVVSVNLRNFRRANFIVFFFASKFSCCGI